MNFIKKIPKSIDNAIQNITDEPTQSIGTLIKDAIYLRFGHISYDAKKRRLFEKYGLLELEKLLESRISETPLEKLVTPDYQTITLAFDNLAPCINSEDLRVLFANLISRSCNSDYKNLIHPSFSEILRQMSPFDAKILKFYVDNQPKQFITYTYHSESGYSFNRIHYMFDTFPNPDESEYVSIAISSLMRLGILAIHDDALVHPMKNSQFAQSSFYKQCELQRIKEGKYQNSNISAQISTITPFGQSFILSCFD